MIVVLIVPFIVWWLWNLKKYFLGRNSALQGLLSFLPFLIIAQCVHLVFFYSICPFYFDTNMITRLLELIYEWLTMMLIVGCDVLSYSVLYLMSYGIFVLVSRPSPMLGYEITVNLSCLMAAEMLSGFLYRSNMALVMILKAIQLLFEVIIALRIVCLAYGKKRQLTKFLRNNQEEIPMLFHESLKLKEKQFK